MIIVRVAYRCKKKILLWRKIFHCFERTCSALLFHLFSHRASLWIARINHSTLVPKKEVIVCIENYYYFPGNSLTYPGGGWGRRMHEWMRTESPESHRIPIHTRLKGRSSRLHGGIPKLTLFPIKRIVEGISRLFRQEKLFSTTAQLISNRDATPALRHSEISKWVECVRIISSQEATKDPASVAWSRFRLLRQYESQIGDSTIPDRPRCFY